MIALLAAAFQPIQILQVDGMQVVKVDLTQCRIKLGLAKDKVGRTDELAAIAKRAGALAAINGSFFEAYAERELKNPEQTLISGGRIVHKGNSGSVLGADKDGNVSIGQPRWRIDGSREGSDKWPHKWFAYWINRYPTGNTVTIYDRAWGGETGVSEGIGVAVSSSGEVRLIGQGSMSIPADGYVIHFRNAEQSLLRSFKEGQKCAYRFTLTDGDPAIWSHVMEGVGAGPQLVREGRAEPDPVMEGFRDPKILTNSGARSAVGFKGKTLYIVAATGTIAQLALKMRKLGCEHAMNLDGGASSGLWTTKGYLRKPGRLISNSLLIMRR